MALDTKYRPLRFDEVVGQEGAITVIRQFVHTKTGFHQSYVFSGGHGGGKTTIGRILARALLCESPQGGDPCDQCPSCRSILDAGSSECFFEVDAATNSGKEDVKKITENLQYSTFSGNRRIYLFDEAHQLSKNALDALLKPMEDSVPGGHDKLLVCIFCTTEPEKMRKTIFSRCAPAFSLRPVSPDQIADRLAYICEQEGIEYERDALVLIAEVCESHIRDSIKAVEGVSKVGAITRKTVMDYLKLDANTIYLDILANLGTDFARVTLLVEDLVQLVSPTTCYEKLAEAAMSVYRTAIHAGVVPSYWDAERVQQVARMHQQYLVAFASKLASRPGRPTASMLLCDLAHLHHGRQGTLAVLGSSIVVPAVPKTPPQRLPTQNSTPVAELPPLSDGNSTPTGETQSESVGKVQTTKKSEPGKPYLTPGGTFVDPRAQKRHMVEQQPTKDENVLDADLFGKLLSMRVDELNDGSRRGPTG